MASILSLIAGLVVGGLAGWLLRGRQIARTQSTSTEAHVPAQSTGSAVAAEDTEKKPALVGAKSEDAGAAESSPAAAPAPVAAVEPADTEPVAARSVATEPVESERVDFEPAEAEPVATEPVIAEPVTSEPVAPTGPAPAFAEPVAAEPDAAEPDAAEPVSAGRVEVELIEAELVEVELADGELVDVAVVETDVVVVQTIAEPDDLTRIAGIGPKMAMALAASGISTFEQLAATPLPQIRAAVTAAGMRLAPTAPTWPEQAKRLAGLTD